MRLRTGEPSELTSCVPCEKLNLATFMPARSTSASLSTVLMDGPSVQMILVLRGLVFWPRMFLSEMSKVCERATSPSLFS